MNIENVNASDERSLTLICSVSITDDGKKFSLSTIDGSFKNELNTEDLSGEFHEVLLSATPDTAFWADCLIGKVGTDEHLGIKKVFVLGRLGLIEDEIIKSLYRVMTNYELDQDNDYCQDNDPDCCTAEDNEPKIPVDVLPSPDALINAFKFLSELTNQGIREPLVNLDREGGFSFNWASKNGAVSILVMNDGDFLCFFRNFSTHKFVSADLNGPMKAIAFIKENDNAKVAIIN